MSMRSAHVLGNLAACLLGAAVLGAQDQQFATPDTRPARVVGRVTDTSGVGLAGAEISLVGDGKPRAISSDSGTFDVGGLPPGAVTFRVRRLGYEPATFSTVLRPGRAHRVSLPLTPVAQAIAGVKVEEVRTATHWLDVFEARRTRQRGTFVTRAEIERTQSHLLADVLRQIPGMRLTSGQFAGSGNRVTATRGAGARRCTPQLYVHQTPYSGTIDDFATDDVEALEIYAGISEIPAELNTMGRPICAAIVIWTRTPGKKPL